MISTEMGITAMRINITTSRKLTFIAPMELFKRNKPVRMVPKIQVYHKISFSTFQSFEMNIFGNKLGMIKRLKLRDKNVIMEKPVIR
jgi:hypothetical protein